jgi:hypothetical protein
VRIVIRRLIGPVLIASLVLTGCGSSHSKSSTTTTAAPRTLSVETPAGAVRVSLDGHLPPGWPSDFPIPPTATPKGSGSLSGSSSAAMVGVFESTASGQDDYNFYKNSSAITVTQSTSAGVGSSFVGRLTFSGSHSGTVTITDIQGQNLIVITLTNNTGNGTPTSATSATS